MDQILNSIRTTYEAQEILAALEQFSSTLFVTKEKDQKSFSHLKPHLYAAINELFNKEDINEDNRDKVKITIKQLQESIKTCKKIQLTLAFQPDEETISDLSSWIKTNAGKEFILDIEIQKTLIGGALITANGLHKDYSMHKKLAEAFQIQKEKIRGTL